MSSQPQRGAREADRDAPEHDGHGDRRRRRASSSYDAGVARRDDRERHRRDRGEPDEESPPPAVPDAIPVRVTAFAAMPYCFV